MINLTPPDQAAQIFIGMTLKSEPPQLESFPPSAEKLAVGRQVHGTRVQFVDGQASSPFFPNTDALVTNEPGMALGLFTADCTPVIIYDPEVKALGAAHAGWRGTYQGILDELLTAMKSRFGCRPERCVGVLGPAISGPCYEVSPDLAEMFRTALPASRPAFTAGAHGRPRLDLRLAQRIQLRNLGMADDRIHTSDICTHCDAERFFSYRRDGKLAGRHLTIAVLR